jgi:hypothetical protein
MTNGGATVVTANGGQPPNGNLERRVAVIEAVLPTLATKADLAELGVELRAEMRLENEKLRAEMRSENEKLLAAMRAENEKLREQLIDRIALIHQQMRTEVREMHNSMFRWMVTTLLTMLIAFSAFFIGLGNLLVSRAPSPNAGHTSTSSTITTIPRALGSEH